MPLILANGKPWLPPQVLRNAPIPTPVKNETFNISMNFSGRSLFEVGETISGVVLTPFYGITPDTVVVTDDKGNPPVRAVSSAVSSIVIPYSYRLTGIGSVTFILRASRGVGAKGFASLTLHVAKRFMWGFLPTGQTAISLGAGLQEKFLQTDRLRSFDIVAGAGNKFWTFYPSSFGSAVFQIDDLRGGVFSPQQLSYTNPFGVTEDFFAYESVNANLGAARPSPVEVL